MKVAVICLLTFAVASAGVIESSLKRQLCENHCNQPTNSGCHYGQICVSNGCGHHCVFPLASAGVIESGLKRQLCENHCNQPTNSGCHYGQICVSNGCGHHCVFPLVKRQRCAPVRCMACPDGYELDEHGCQTCQCRPAKRSPCPMYMCAMYCDNGFRVGADGCYICSCA